MKRNDQPVCRCAVCHTPVVLDDKGSLSIHREPGKLFWKDKPCVGSMTLKFAEEHVSAKNKKAA